MSNDDYKHACDDTPYSIQYLSNDTVILHPHWIIQHLPKKQKQNQKQNQQQFKWRDYHHHSLTDSPSAIQPLPWVFYPNGSFHWPQEQHCWGKIQQNVSMGKHKEGPKTSMASCETNTYHITRRSCY